MQLKYIVGANQKAIGLGRFRYKYFVAMLHTMIMTTLTILLHDSF